MRCDKLSGNTGSGSGGNTGGSKYGNTDGSICGNTSGDVCEIQATALVAACTEHSIQIQPR